MEFMPESWGAIWAIETPILELLVRGAAMYLGILFLLRIFPRRDGGELATMDLVLILLMTEAATHALGDYTSLGDGLFLITTVLVINFATNALSYRVRWIERLVSSPPLPIIVDGRMLGRNMRREFITEEELKGYLRMNDIEDVSEVKRAYVESEGHITFVTRES